MKIILALTLMFVAIASACAGGLPTRDVAAMVANIEYVMGRGLCAVSNDTADRGTQKMTVVVDGLGEREILVNDYNWMREPGYAKSPNGRFVMSNRAEEACGSNSTGGRCLAFRSFVSRVPPDIRRPGNGVRIIPL